MYQMIVARCAQTTETFYTKCKTTFEMIMVMVLDHQSSENDDSTLCTERKKEGDAKAFHNPFLLL